MYWRARCAVLCLNARARSIALLRWRGEPANLIPILIPILLEKKPEGIPCPLSVGNFDRTGNGLGYHLQIHRKDMWRCETFLEAFSLVDLCLMMARLASICATYGYVYWIRGTWSEAWLFWGDGRLLRGASCGKWTSAWSWYIVHMDRIIFWLHNDADLL